MSSNVSEKIKAALPEKLSAGCEPGIGKADDVLPQDIESSYMDDSDEFTDWSEDDDDNSQNLDDDLESNFSEKRCSGDGEEQPSCLADRYNKRVDDDEDRKNPAYVPRKGSFFEHDLRRDELDHYASDSGKKNRDRCRGRRGMWSWERTKWEHDRFDERSQRPKSVHELVTFYGFNIRKDCRSLSGFRRLSSRNKITSSSSTTFARKNLRSNGNPMRTFIVLRNEGKLGGEESDESSIAAFIQDEVEKTRSNRSKHNSFSSSTRDSLISSHPVDFEIERARGSYRALEEPVVCFAPRRGEKVPSLNEYAVSVETTPTDRTRSNLKVNGIEENGLEGDDVSEHSAGEFTVGRSVFRGGGNLATMKKKRFCAGSGRIAPVVGSKFKPRSDFYQNFVESSLNDESFSSDELSSSNSVRHASIDTSWKGYSRPDSAAARTDYSPNFRNTYRSRFRGKFRNCGKLHNYCYNGVFPQDVRLIVMCGEGNDASGNVNNEEATDNLSSGSKVQTKLERDEKTLLTTNQDLILPPVTCCIKTRKNRLSCDSVVYTVALSASATISTASSTPSGGVKPSVTDITASTSALNAHSTKPHEKITNNLSNPAIKDDRSAANSLKYDSVNDKSHLASNDNEKGDKRYSSQRVVVGGESKGRSSYPRFPVPPRNRIFHPNSFSNGSQSPFLPTAFILPAGPIFSGSQRHPSMPQISTNMERTQILGLNSHRHHQLLALPVRVTPVPFILASSQSLSMPPAQQIQQHQVTSSTRLPLLTASPSSSSNSSSAVSLLPSSSSSSLTISSSSLPTSSSSAAVRMTSSPSVSRPTSFFHPGSYRNSPHPKHWPRFNYQYYNMVKSNVTSGFQFPLNVHPTLPVSCCSVFNKSNAQVVSASSAASKASSSLVTSASTMSASTVSASTVSASTVSASTVSASTASELLAPTSLSACVITSKLSPHAAAFRSSQQSADSAENVSMTTGEKLADKKHDGSTKSNTFGKPDVNTLYEVPLFHQSSKYWYKSRKACPIEVRGGTVYFSPELQQFQYKCYPSGSKRGLGGACGFTAGNVVYFSPNARQQMVTDSKEKSAAPRKPKKVLPIVDPKAMKNESIDSSLNSTQANTTTTTLTAATTTGSTASGVTETTGSDTPTATSMANASTPSPVTAADLLTSEVLNEDKEFLEEEVIKE